MSRLPNAPFTPSVEQQDGTIQFNSNQPTIRIVRETRNTFRYLVYMGQAHESHGENDLVWARLQVSGRGSSISFYVGPGRSRITTVEFFKDKYTLAFWLDRLMEKFHAHRSLPLDTLGQQKDFLHDVLRVVLEECTGAESTEFSKLVNLYVGTEDGPGLRARYYSPFYPTNAHPHQAVVVENDEGSERGVPATREIQPGKQNRDRKPADDTIEEVNGQAGDVNDGSVNGSDGRESDQIAVNDINADRTGRQTVRLKRSSSQRSISGQEHANNSDKTLVQGAEELAASDEPTDVPNNAVNCMGDHAVNAPWADGINRLFIQPAKEKALSTIERHLQDWREGSIDEVAFDSNIRASLSDIRLARQMRNTLIQSKQNAPVGPGQDHIFENDRKRRADPDDDTARSSKAVRGNGELGS
ncbi:hypothetical protein LTS15_003166 [Exophiala xenobiotica]|nr:hypothetical protein LTS15_003166 [Exophiala xenobiotica]